MPNKSKMKSAFKDASSPEHQHAHTDVRKDIAKRIEQPTRRREIPTIKYAPYKMKGSPMKRNFPASFKHLAHDGMNQVPHSNTLTGNISDGEGGFHVVPHDHKNNPRSKKVN